MMKKTLEQVKLPRVSEEHDESLVTFWHKSVGDLVEEGEVLVEVQTEKAVSEIHSDYTGYIQEIHIKRGEVARVDELLATIDIVEENTGEPSTVVEGQKQPDALQPRDKSFVKAPPRVRKMAKELGIDLSTILGTGKNGTHTIEDVQAAVNNLNQEEPTALKEEKLKIKKFIAAPSVRRAARDYGINLEDIQGSGKNGRILLEDLEVYQKNIQEQPQPKEEITQVDESLADTAEEIEREPLVGIRKAIAKAMVRSVQTVPHVTHFDEVDVSSLVVQRDRFKQIAKEKQVKLTYLPYIVKALVSTLKEFKALNASIDEENEEILYKKYYNIGIAVQTENGLIVPTIKNADQKSILKLAMDIEQLTTKARKNKLNAQDISNGTCTISNIGSVRGQWFTPIINHPETAILGVGQITDKPIIDENGEFAKGKMLSLSLSYDHRLIDGAMAQNALNYMKQLLKDPELLLFMDTQN
jgi:pyruvate dehydrogenase E2 component (dihydrolipoamide acetyltransferase)